MFEFYFRIERMQKVGLIQKWIQDNLPERDKCWESLISKEANNHKVNLYDMQGSFFLLFFGNYCFSLSAYFVLIIIEVLIV